MSASHEWTEWHLTPRGWEVGTEKEDFSYTERTPPADRVFTAIYREYVSSPHGGGGITLEYVWGTDNAEVLNALWAKFGLPPAVAHLSPKQYQIIDKRARK